MEVLQQTLFHTSTRPYIVTFALQVPHPAGMAATAVSESHPQVSPPLQVPRLSGQGE